MRLFSKILQVGLATEPLSEERDTLVRLLHDVDARSRRLFGRALAIFERTLDDNHPHLVTCRENLADLQ